MDIKKTKKVTEVKSVTVGHKCDNCGKVHKGDFPDEWHHFSSHHNEWGNDSIESYEYHDVCSPECYVEKLTEVVEGEMSGIYDGEVDNMEIQFARRMVEYFNSGGAKKNPIAIKYQEKLTSELAAPHVAAFAENQKDTTTVHVLKNSLNNVVGVFIGSQKELDNHLENHEYAHIIDSILSQEFTNGKIDPYA